MLLGQSIPQPQYSAVQVRISAQFMQDAQTRFIVLVKLPPSNQYQEPILRFKAEPVSQLGLAGFSENSKLTRESLGYHANLVVRNAA